MKVYLVSVEFLPLVYIAKKNITRQLATMVATSKMSYFQVITTILTNGTDDSSLKLSLSGARATIKVKDHHYWWLAWWLFELEIGDF